MLTIVLLGLAKFAVSAFGAVIFGALITLLFCLLTRLSHKISTVEPLLFLLCAMFSYVVADTLLMSGVISVMTSALVLCRYSEFNIQPDSKITFKTMTHMLANALETLLFLSIGF